MRSHTLGLGIAALASIGVAAGQPDIAHIDGADEAAVDAWRFGEVDAARLLAEDAAAGFGPERFAETHDTLISPADSGTLTDNGDGTLRWRLRLESADGLSVNFGSLFDVPPSTVMTLRDGDGRSPYRPITAADAGPTGELWSPLVPGPVMEIDITVAADDWDAFRAGFWITHVNLGYRPMGGAWARDQLGRSERSGGDRGVFATDSCLVDILCPLGDPWRPVHAKGVALYTLQGNLRCSGAMVNNTAEDGDPLFLTAHPCTPAVDPSSIVVYWNMQNSYCRPAYSQESGEIGDGQYTDFTLGGVTVLAELPEADYALVRLNNTPDPAFDVRWLGWDRSESIPASTIGISHPGAQEKRIHRDDQPAINSEYDATHAGFPIMQTWLIQVEEGGVQGGSSGSPLFDPAGRIIGTATTARPREPEPNYCPQQVIEYGRLSYAWDNEPGFAAALDPLDTGQLTLDYLGYVSPCAGDANNDGFTNVFDFNTVLANFGAGPDAQRDDGDLTGDGLVNIFDYNAVTAGFGCGTD